MRSLLGQIHARGHEIGVHLSYNTYKDVSQIKARQIAGGGCVRRRMSQAKWGERMHYLRWEHPKIFVLLLVVISQFFGIIRFFLTARSVSCAKEFLAVNFDQASEA